MRQVELVAGRLRTTVLGFGTAGFGRTLTEREALRLLETAFGYGIRHFDTAPLYGDGRAEMLLGRFLPARRDEVTVATKVGIAPASGPAAVTAGRAIARHLGPLRPWLRKIPRKWYTPPRRPVPAEPRFALGNVRSSLDRSLRQLRTDHVDVLLLHEVRADEITDELIDLLDEFISAGKISAAGTATSGSQTDLVLQRQRAFPAVAQIPGEASEGDPPLSLGNRGLVLHSILVRELQALERYVTRSEERSERWRDVLGDKEDLASMIAALLLHEAATSHRRAAVLFASSQPERIRSTTRAFAALADHSYLALRLLREARQEIAAATD